jgi:hypothetical protein
MTIFALAFIATAAAFKPFYPQPQVVSVDKTLCKITFPGRAIKKEVHLNVSAANLLNFNGQIFYYYFFDDTNTLVEIAQLTVGANPQIVPVTQLKNGVTYGVKPFAVQPTGTITGPWHQFFTTQFDCIKKTVLPKSNPSSTSTNTGGAKQKN